MCVCVRVSVLCVCMCASVCVVYVLCAYVRVSLCVYGRGDMSLCLPPVIAYNPLVATRLVRNYRAHPSLLHVTSNLFYDDDLKGTCARIALVCCSQREARK